MLAGLLFRMRPETGASPGRAIGRVCRLLVLILLQSVQSDWTLAAQPCATDPMNGFIESLQRAAYAEDPAALVQLRQGYYTPAEQLRADFVRGTKRPNGKGSPGALHPSNASTMPYGLAFIHLPTCYEDPLIYFLLKKNVRLINIAREELGYPLSYVPKYGSAPTRSVNALTYEVEGENQRVIIFNSELFRFSRQVAQLTVQTIPLEGLQDPTAIIDASGIDVVTDFFSHPQWKGDAMSAGLRLLGLPAPGTQSLDQKYDYFAIPFLAGMDLFVVGHEFGHIINTDRPPPAPEMKPETPEYAAKIAAWTWPQELRADEVGTKLVAKALGDEAQTNSDAADQARYALRGALLFMECLEIVDDAAYVQKHGNLPPEWSAEAKTTLRYFVDGKLSARSASRALGRALDPYPPPWLRRERLQQILLELERGLPDSERSRQQARMADILLTRMSVYWSMTRVDLENRQTKLERPVLRNGNPE